MCKRAKELMSEHSVAGELIAYRLSYSDCLTLIHCIQLVDDKIVHDFIKLI